MARHDSKKGDERGPVTLCDLIGHKWEAWTREPFIRETTEYRPSWGNHKSYQFAWHFQRSCQRDCRNGYESRFEWDHSMEMHVAIVRELEALGWRWGESLPQVVQ